jgi:hypothetical protein
MLGPPAGGLAPTKEEENTMNRSLLPCLVAIALALVVAAPAVAQTKPSTTTNMDILKEKLKADKKLLVAHSVGVTEAEGKAFWPIYDAYQADLDKINQRLKTAIEGYAKDYNANTMTDAKASALTTEALSIEEALVTLKKNYVAKLTGVIPAMKIARFVQLENKVRAEVNYELAAGIPFVQ